MNVIPNPARRIGAEGVRNPPAQPVGVLVPLRECPLRQYFVYIVASLSRTIYVGVTSNLERRMWEPKHKVVKGFTTKYGVDRLVHMEEYANVDDAIAREKEIKAWRREKKLALIEAENPRWRDFSHGWFE